MDEILLYVTQNNSETLEDPIRGRVHFWIREFGAGNGEYFTKKNRANFISNIFFHKIIDF